MHLLTTTTETLFYSEQEAYAYVDEKRQNKNVEASSVKYKKPTKKTVECWIATVKVRSQDVKDLIGESESVANQ